MTGDIVTGDVTGDAVTPLSGITGMVWPALPAAANVNAFAVLFQLEQSQWWTAEEILGHQLRQAQQLAAFALDNVPFYDTRLAPLRGLAEGALTPELWRRLPVLTRAEIQETGPGLSAPRSPKNHGRRLTYAGAGAIGRPVRIQGTALAHQFRNAIGLRANIWHRRDYSGKMAAIQHLNSAQRKLAESGERARWSQGYPTGPMLYRDIAGPVDDHLAWLAAENPDYLMTYASSALVLAERAAETGHSLPGLKDVAVFGEPAGADLRAACRRAWDVNVVDSYSAIEVGPVAIQCPDHDHLHIQAEALLVEILDDDGAPCRPGAVGRVVITALHNFAMPLIRYEIGDYAEVGAPCACGRGLPSITRVLGRQTARVMLPDGERRFVRIDGAALSGVAPLRQVQMVQRSRDEIEVRLVATRQLDQDELARLGAILRRGLGHRFPLRVAYVDAIARSDDGTFEDFRCEVPDAAAARDL